MSNQTHIRTILFLPSDLHHVEGSVFDAGMEADSMMMVPNPLIHRHPERTSPPAVQETPPWFQMDRVQNRRTRLGRIYADAKRSEYVKDGEEQAYLHQKVVFFDKLKHRKNYHVIYTPTARSSIRHLDSIRNADAEDAKNAETAKDTEPARDIEPAKNTNATRNTKGKRKAKDNKTSKKRKAAEIEDDGIEPSKEVYTRSKTGKPKDKQDNGRVMVFLDNTQHPSPIHYMRVYDMLTHEGALLYPTRDELIWDHSKIYDIRAFDAVATSGEFRPKWHVCSEEIACNLPTEVTTVLKRSHSCNTDHVHVLDWDLTGSPCGTRLETIKSNDHAKFLKKEGGTGLHEAEFYRWIHQEYVASLKYWGEIRVFIAMRNKKEGGREPYVVRMIHTSFLSGKDKAAETARLAALKNAANPQPDPKPKPKPKKKPTQKKRTVKGKDKGKEKGKADAEGKGEGEDNAKDEEPGEVPDNEPDKELDEREGDHKTKSGKTAEVPAEKPSNANSEPPNDDGDVDDSGRHPKWTNKDMGVTTVDRNQRKPFKKYPYITGARIERYALSIFNRLLLYNSEAFKSFEVGARLDIGIAPDGKRFFMNEVTRWWNGSWFAAFDDLETQESVVDAFAASFEQIYPTAKTEDGIGESKESNKQEDEKTRKPKKVKLEETTRAEVNEVNIVGGTRVRKPPTRYGG
jgi:hypothetical protein